MKTIAVLVAVVLALAGCTDTDRAKFGSYGEKQTVCLFAADGHLVGKWVSSGKVDSNGSLHVFNDAATNQYVKVSGSVVVSAADFCK